MKKAPPVDSLPEFEGLALRSSALMLAARGHRAKDELFEAAVSWVKAGRACAELGTALLQAGHAYEATQDFLNAARCFLEAGDHRPADRELEKLEKFPQLREALRGNPYWADEHAEIRRWSHRLRQELDAAREELRRQMEHPDAAHKLKDSWLQEILSQMPGVSDFHWFAAQKLIHLRKTDKAIEHFSWCVELNPENVGFWVVLILSRVDWKSDEEATRVADKGLARHPNNALLYLCAGWARMKQVLNKSGPKVLLQEARAQLATALKLSQFSPKFTLITTCALHICLSYLGHRKEAIELLQKIMLDYPIPTAELAWRMLQADNQAAESRILEREMNQIMAEVAA